MEITEVVQFIMGSAKLLSALTNLESVLETLDDLAVTSLGDWQASKAYATLTGNKKMCTPLEFILFVHKAQSLVHGCKLAKPVSASAKEDVYLISQSLHDVLKSPATARHSFVWQHPRSSGGSLMRRRRWQTLQRGEI